MWPDVDIENGKICLAGQFITKYKDEEVCKDASTIIKEIVMIYAFNSQLSYNKEEVPLVVEYDTEYGIHTILFSKVKNLQYKNRGIEWTATYTSDSEKTVIDDGMHAPEDNLTEMFINMLKEAIELKPLNEELVISIQNLIEKTKDCPCGCWSKL